MALTKVNEAEVQSTEGFRLKISRGQLTYLESEGRYLALEADYVPDDKTLHVYFQRNQDWMKRGKPDGLLDKIAAMTIKQRIGASLDLLGVRHSIHQD